MAFGIEAYSSSGYLQFSTETESLNVISTSTVANNSSLAYNNDNEFLAYNRTTTGYIRGQNNDTLTSWTNYSGNSVNVMKLRRTGVLGAGAEDESGTFGVRVFGSSSQLLYSSNFSKGQEVVNIISPGSIGNPAALGYNAPNANNPRLLTTDPTDYWICMGGSMIYDTAWGDGVRSENNTYWNYSTNEVEYINIWGFELFGGLVYIGAVNQGAIVLLKQKD